MAGVALLSGSILAAGVATMQPAAVAAPNPLPVAQAAVSPGANVGGCLIPPPPTAACCDPEGECSITTLAACAEIGGVWHHEWVDCSIAHCTQPVGACCFHDGLCAQLSDADCTQAGGWSWAEGVLCDLNACPARGDLNCDGSVNAFDIDPFVLALTSAPSSEAYYAVYPNCDGLLADVNCDGAVNAFDIDPFVQCLTSGGCPPCP